MYQLPAPCSLQTNCIVAYFPQIILDKNKNQRDKRYIDGLKSGSHRKERSQHVLYNLHSKYEAFTVMACGRRKHLRCES